MRVFEEKQRFTQWWLWLLIAIPLVFILFEPFKMMIGRGTLSIEDLGNGFWVGLIAIVLVYIFIALCHLTVVIDENGVAYQLFPFQINLKRVPWKNLEKAYTRKYLPITEYGGWGYRIGLKGKAINIRGNHGIQLMLKSGKKLLLGTQRPEEAQLVILKYFKNERI